MTNILKNSIFYIIIIFLLIYKSVFINIISNINSLVKDNEDTTLTEINLLKEKNNFLEKELANISSLSIYTNYNYDLTRLSYRKSYTDYDFYIYGGKEKYKENYALVNNDGLVGVITKTKDEYSECKMLPGVNNLSVNINSSYGTLSSYKDGLFIIDNISNYDDIKLNDSVYTSTLGTIKEKILIGTVFKIEENDIEKIIYVKSKVDFNNINYLYVIGE